MLKVPPFRRKPESPRRRRKISRRFAAAEIPAFAGMGRSFLAFATATIRAVYGIFWTSAPRARSLPGMFS
ncbi:MAG: hypothetical protein ACR2QC_05050 [Gammaproteobacteria bacterium]